MNGSTQPATPVTAIKHLPLAQQYGNMQGKSIRWTHNHLPMQRSCGLVYLVVAGMIICSIFITSNEIHNLAVRVHLSPSHRGLLTAAVSDGKLSNLARAVDSSSSGLVPEWKHWDTFWTSPERQDLETLQHLKNTLDHMRYQRLSKDVEYQDTAGLDVMLATSLQKLAKSTELYKTQEWLKAEVTAAVFAAINKQQFTSNCSTARKLVCRLGKNCGFGCEVHHAAHCLSIAIATNRTMILQVYPSNYMKAPDTWEQVFAPLSTCTNKDLKQQARPTVTAPAFLHESSDEVFVGIIDPGAAVVDAPAMPPDVLDLVKLFVGRPHIWWQGVLISWLLRPSQLSQLRHSSFRQQHHWASPIAGVHIRRTDKLQAEAKLHQVAEYMTHVERFCDVRCSSGWQQRALKQLEAGVGLSTTTMGNVSTGSYSECSVYLASDDESVVAEVKRVYRHINIKTNPVGTHTGAVELRYSNDGLLGVYDDIIHLANTDFLVGTFSSQVSRLAYEIAQVNTSTGVTDASFHYHSVDSQWYFGGQQQYRYCLAHDYTDKGQQTLKAGQQVICPIINEYQFGYMVCRHPGGHLVSVPPGSLTPCKDELSGYRRLLPAHMHQPAVEVW